MQGARNDTDINNIGVKPDEHSHRHSSKLNLSDPSVPNWVVPLFILSLVIAWFAIFLAVTGGAIIGAANKWILALLIGNLALILLFIALLWQRFRETIDKNQLRSAGSRIHVRYVRIFMLAAAIPAVIIAAFSSLTIGPGIQGWLSGKVKEAISATRELGNQQVNQISASVKVQVLNLSADLNAASSEFYQNRAMFKDYLKAQAEKRGISAIYLVNRKNEVVLDVSLNGAPKSRQNIDQDDFLTADAGDISFNLDENGVAGALYRLANFTDIYVQVIEPAPSNVIDILRQAKQVSDSYRIIEERQAQIQSVFALGFAETALLVIVAAGWIGLVSATRISFPIARLAAAAQEVREGNYSVRIEAPTKVEELTALTQTFNEMMSEIKDQKAALEKSKEEAISRSEFIQAVFEGVSAGVISLDANNKVKSANLPAASLLGVERNELFERGLKDIAPEILEIAVMAKKNNLSSGMVERERGNETLIFDVKTSIAGDDKVITFDEVSSRLASQRQAAWRDVARRIAHEIKNPLTPIQLSAERLARKFGAQIVSDKETYNKLTSTIVRQVTDIGRMVDEFSSFARMPAPKFNDHNICEIINEVYFSQKIAFPAIEYEIDIPPEPILISMDERLFAQAFLNIMKNAAESVTQRSSAETNFSPKIGITANVKNQEFCIYVSDNGVGFPEQNRLRLLEPYITTRSKGTGLGLPIVVRIIEEHQGSLRLLDRDDGIKGAVVSIILPILTKDTKLDNMTPGEENAK